MANESDPIVILSYARTPMGSFQGALSPLAHVFVLLAILGFILMLLAGGMVFAAYELHRLGRSNDLVEADTHTEFADDREFRQLVA